MLQTVLCAQLESFPDPQRPHAQGAGRDPKYLRKSVSILDLVSFFALVVTEDEVAIFG
jgi:hypothetical protein